MVRKVFLLSAVLCFLVVGPARGDPDVTESKEKAEKKISKCQKFEIYGEINDCLKCHVIPTMRIRQEDPHRWRDYPNAQTRIYRDANGDYGYFYFIDSVDHDLAAKRFEEFFRYLEQNNISRAIIEIQSFGGSVFEGWRIKGIISEFQSCGMDITTKVQSVAASAATMIFLAADKRLVAPTAELMVHELWTFKFLSIESPADKEDEARVLRHIQDTITDWIASRSNLSKVELDEKIRKKEFWIRGSDAVDMGFATGLIRRCVSW